MGELNPQVTYKPVHKNPMDKNRNPTDTKYLYIFGILLAAWFIMNCTYLFRGNTMHNITENDILIHIPSAQNQAIVTLPTIFHQSGVGLIIWIALSGTIIFLLFLKTLHCLPRFWAIVGLIVLAMAIIGCTIKIFLTIYSVIRLPDAPPAVVLSVMLAIVKSIASIIYLAAGFNATRTVTVDGLVKIIKKTSDAIFFFPTVFLFGFIIMTFILTVIAFTAVSLYSMDNAITGVLCFLGGAYLLSVVFNFAVVVISQCIATWYWTKNKEEISGFIILKSIGLVGRNHIGSIAFGSTFLLPVILSIYVLCTNKFPSPPNSRFKAFLVKWGLIVYAPDYALTLIASHGIGFHEATKKIYSLFTRSCAVVLSFCCVIGSVLAVFLVLAMLVSVGVAIAIFQNQLLADKEFLNAAGVYYGLGVYLFIAVLATATVTANTVLVNTTEEIEETEEREMNHVQGDI